MTGSLEKQMNVCNCENIGIKLCDSLRMQYGFDAISLMPTNLMDLEIIIIHLTVM